MKDFIKDKKIIDFHTHPYLSSENDICQHTEFCDRSPETTLKVMEKLGVKTFCGSVISVAPLKENETRWDRIKKLNEEALELRRLFNRKYIPGFHVHPDYIEESVKEIDKFAALGLKLIGELVPYMDGWEKYDNPALNEIADYAATKNMIISLHTMPDEDDLDRFVAAHKNITIVAAHPGEKRIALRHIERLKKYDNYYLDLSGTGLFRYGLLRRLIDEGGAEKILYGSDYPTCNPSTFIGGVLLDDLITDKEREAILYKNAQRILGIK